MRKNVPANPSGRIRFWSAGVFVGLESSVIAKLATVDPGTSVRS
jgi:hypothetical protein